MVMSNRKPLYYSPANEGFEQINSSDDSISASGYVFKDTEFFITLDNSNNIILKDANGSKILGNLAEKFQIDNIQSQLDSINNTMSSFNVIDGGSPSSVYGGIDDIDGGTP